MKNIFLKVGRFILALSLGYLICIGNSAYGFHEIKLGIIMPDSHNLLNNNALSLLKTKINSAITTNGISSESEDNAFVVYPVVNLQDEATVEGGMAAIHTVQLSLVLYLKQVATNTVFSTFSKTLKGSSSTKEKALRNAINQLKFNDEGISVFLNEGSQKVKSYFEKNCTSILNEVKKLKATGAYDAALSQLSGFPSELGTCSNEREELTTEIFLLHSNQTCNQIIIKASSLISSNKISEGLLEIQKIDPFSSCYSDALKLIEEAKADMDSEDQKNWDNYLSLVKNQTALIKYRYRAIESIAKAYYARQTYPVVRYYQIIR